MQTIQINKMRIRTYGKEESDPFTKLKTCFPSVECEL